MFTLPKLPYAIEALEPYISSTTMETHHGKHHRKYVDTLNKLIEATSFQDKQLNEIIVATKDASDSTEKKIFNNAAQHWNHSFLWQSLTPQPATVPGPILDAIERDFGDFATFSNKFVEEGSGHFASGWVWLVGGEGKLEIISTHDADLPLAHGKTALLTCDLWEHAYYLDYKNDRQGFLETFIDKLANWEFAAVNFTRWSNAQAATV